MKFNVIFIISTLILVFFFMFGKIFTCRRLSCITMDSLSSYKIKDIYQENNKTFRALYTNKERILRVETLSQIDQFTADQYINANITQIKGLFTDALAPYPGIASNVITCDTKYKPLFDRSVTANKLDVVYFVAYLNRNLTYGSCTETQAVYKGISAYFYCSKNKWVYHLEIISPIKSYESSLKNYQNMIRSIKCN